MLYERANSDRTIIRRNITYKAGQKKALEYLKKVSGVPVSVSIQLAIDEYLEKRLKGEANG